MQKQAKTLLLVGSGDPAGHPLVRAVSEAAWPPGLELEHAQLEQLARKPSLLKNAAVAWVVLDEPGEEGTALYELTAFLQDRHIPALLTRPDETRPAGEPFQEGILTAPPDASPQTVGALLNALQSQRHAVTSLLTELRLNQAYQGSLCNQIGKFDEELRLAAQLQREFLPGALPSLGGVSFRAFYRPAGYVSGDVYDVVRLDEDHIGFFLADAVGHGVSAALMTMYIKRALLTKEITDGQPPGYRIVGPDEALARLNNDMLQLQASSVRYATACYGVINCRTLEVNLARAGHPLPIVLKADGQIEPINPDGTLLGILPDQTFEPARFTLSPGDRLLVFSDGFEAAMRRANTDNDPNAFDPDADRLQLLREWSGGGDLDESMRLLAERLDHGAGSLHQEDDITAILLGTSSETTGQAPSLSTAPGKA